MDDDRINVDWFESMTMMRRAIGNLPKAQQARFWSAYDAIERDFSIHYTRAVRAEPKAS